MTETWVIADTHFGHENICKFTTKQGGKLRPWDSASEMDEAMVALWNAKVKPEDRVYVLGDAVIGRRHLATFGRLNGRKALVKGNHDIFKLSDYLPYFDDIRGACVKKAPGDKYQVVMTHVPIHPSSVVRWGLNVHGHLHSNCIEIDGVPDKRYFCVSAEQTGFAPLNWNTDIPWDELGVS